MIPTGRPAQLLILKQKSEQHKELLTPLPFPQRRDSKSAQPPDLSQRPHRRQVEVRFHLPVNAGVVTGLAGQVARRLTTILSCTTCSGGSSANRGSRTRTRRAALIPLPEQSKPSDVAHDMQTPTAAPPSDVARSPGILQSVAQAAHIILSRAAQYTHPVQFINRGHWL